MRLIGCTQFQAIGDATGTFRQTLQCFLREFKTLRTTVWHLLFFTGSLLLGFSDEAKSKRSLPPVFLNHLYLVVDRETYQEIGESEFITNEFAFVRKTTVTAGGGQSWSGTYLMGRQTYLELFEPSGPNSSTNTPQFKLQQSGIAFGPDSEGGINLILTNLTEEFGNKVMHNLRRKQIGQQEVPWFHYVDVKHDTNTAIFNSWFMEYHKDYWRHRYPEAREEENGITRRHYLMRSFRTNQVMGDIVEVTVALPEPERGRFIRELQAVNYSTRQAAEGWECIGPDIKVVVVSSTEDALGVVQVQMTMMAGRTIKTPLRFGRRSVLRQEGNRAVWNF